MPNNKGSSPEDESGAEDADDGTRAANKRACDYCHRQKMRCIKPGNPPCNRCRQGGHDCTFNGPRKSKGSRVDDRLKMVEMQMSSFQNSLTELLQFQRANAQSQAQTSHSPLAGPSRSSEYVAHPVGAYPAQPLFNMSTIEGHSQREQQFLHPRLDMYPQPSPESRQNIAYPLPLSNMDSASSGKRPYSVAAIRPRSPASSDEDLDPAITTASFPGPWRSMMSLAEAARLKADNQLTKDETGLGRTSDAAAASDAARPENGGRSHPFDYAATSPSGKKRRRSYVEENAGLQGAMPVQRGSQKHAHKDPVELGLIDEDRGRALFEIFMQNCHFYIPAFDPDQDTWTSMRQRSPFVIAAAIFIGLKCEEAGGAVSELQNKLREHAEKIGMSTLFTPVARIEVVQALIIMAQWGDTIYRPGGHALRIATEMGLWRCLPYLVQTGMGAGKSQAELAEERPLVVGARVWLTIFKTECQMAFNSGRPLGISLESVRDARRLLDHPLAIATDSRLVPFCELQTFRFPLHTPFTIWPSTSHMPDLDERLRDINAKFVSWYSYWDSYYESKGYFADSLLRVTLTTMLCGTSISCNSLILNGVRSRRDVALLSEERHGFLLKAVQAAESLMTTAFRGEKGRQYLDRFRYANLNTHVNFAFVARFLIRMSSLVPEAVNLRQVGRDVEQCAKILSDVPGFQFAQLLRDILLKARKKQVLPPPSRASSPPLARSTPFSNPLSLQSAQPYASPGMTGFSPNGRSESAMSNGLGMPELDFGLAEQLFSEERGEWAGGGGGFGFGMDGGLSGTNGTTADQNLGFDPWFPFPPLESDLNSVTMLNTFQDGHPTNNTSQPNHQAHGSTSSIPQIPSIQSYPGPQNVRHNTGADPRLW